MYIFAVHSMTGMMKHMVLTLLLCFLTFSIAGCREGKDTAATLTEAEALMYTSPDSALQMLEAIPHPERLTGREQADYALLLTQARHRCNVIATSDSLIQIAVSYFDNQENRPMSANAWLYLGNVYIDKKDYSEATLALKHAESCITPELSPRILSMIHNKLGYMNRKDSNYPQAFFYFQKAMTIDKQEKFMDWYVSDLTNILNLPLQEVTDSASIYINQMLENLSAAHPDLQAKAYNNIGRYYEMQEKEDSAKYYYQKAIQTSKSSPYRAYLNLAQIYDEQGKFTLSDSLLQQALHTPVWATRAKIYETLYHRFLNSGRYQEAQTYMKEYLAAVDSFYTQQKEQRIREIQAKYDNEVLAREKVETENLFYRILLGGVGVLLAMSAGAYWLYAQRKKNIKQIQECISEIELLTDEKSNAEVEIRQLNQILSQSNALRDEVMKAKGEWSSLDDIRALGLYTRLCQNLQYYNPSSDYEALLHWVNITSNHFVCRVTEKYPHLSSSEITLCCLARMGYSVSQIAEILHIKPTSVSRYIYRVCESLDLTNSKESFLKFVLSF